MTTDEKMNAYTDYDEDDDDCGYDEFLENIENEYETFEERLERCNISLDELRIKFAAFSDWYNDMLVRIGAECRQKAIVCRALCRYIRSNGFDDDIMRFWCICESEYFDCVLADGYDWDEQSRLFNFISLEEDIQNYIFRLKNENMVKGEFRKLRSGISFMDKPAAKIDAKKLYHDFLDGFDIDGPEFEANFETVTSDICHSPELYKAAPLVYYGVITRQTKKMTGTNGYEPNYKAVLETKLRCIDKDNGKNLDSIALHIEVYKFFKRKLEGRFDEFFCDMGFSVMSNIVQCDLLPIDGIKRPLYYQLKDSGFSAFPNGYFDNPIAVKADVHSDDVENYEYYDEKLPSRFSLLKKIRPFIAENKSFSDEYLDLVVKNGTDQCMPIVLGIFNGSDVEKNFIKLDLMDIVYAVIIDELQKAISDRIQSEMLEMIKLFEKEEAKL